MKTSTSFNHILAVALATTGLAGFSAPAFAQDAQASQADDGSIKEIIVSARRRNESIQTTPVAVTAIAPSQLEGAAALTIGDLQGAAPNVLITVQATGSAAANVSIRGIAFADIEKSFDPAVGINVDGVYIGTSTGQMLDFFDIGSIEILRGPQGTLFGRNTIAGVINIKRSRPTQEWGGKFETSFGKYGAIGARGVVNMPIIAGVLGVKVFEMHQESDGYYIDGVTGRHRGGNNNENFGASFLLTPSSNFDALLTLEQQEQKFEPMTGPLTRTGDVFCGFLPVCNGNGTKDVYTVYPVGPQFGTYRAPAATLEMNLDAGLVKFTSVTSYRKSTERQVEDYSTSGLYIGDRAQKYHQFSQELRGSGKIGDNFDYVAGVYYFKSRYHLIQNTLVFGGAGPVQDTVGTSESFAGFLDVNWEIVPRVRISGGGRWTHDKKTMHTIYTADYGTANDSWSKFTPKVGIDYRPTDELMVYASWSRGYRSGGFNGRGLTLYSSTLAYNPETVDSYEVGFKSEFFDRKLSLNVAAFYTDYKDIQQSTTIALAGGTGNETIVSNAASAKIKGLEADITARPFEGMTVRTSVGYTSNKFGGFVVTQPVGSVNRDFDFSGVDMIYAPKITFALSGEYEHPLAMGPFDGKIKLNAGYRYLSRYDQQIAADPATVFPLTGVVPVLRNDPRLRSDAQNLVDASLSFIWDMNNSGAKARFTVYGRNLLDDRGTQTEFTVAAWPTLWGFAAAREPQTYGVQLGFEF